jgi:hypothetical protein
MATNRPKRGDDLTPLEGGGGGGGGRSGGKYTFDRITGSRSAKDHKEKADRESEFSGEISFGSPRGRSSDSSDRTPRMSDDYAKGGKVSSASSRADGCAVKGKTKGRFV